MKRWIGTSSTSGMVHGEIVPAEEALKNPDTFLASEGPRNVLVAFPDLPKLADFIKVARSPRVVGCLMPEWSPYSHLNWAITYHNIPTVGLDISQCRMRSNRPVFIDGGRGEILIPETASEESELRHREDLQRAANHSLQARAMLPATSKSGVHVQVLAQIQYVEDVGFAQRNGADGVGEIKSEVVLKGIGPTDSVISSIVSAIQAQTKWHPVPIRFPDFTVDKQMSTIETPIMQGPLGYRGIRALEIDHYLVRRFLDSLDGLNLNDVIIVLPMVTVPSEVNRFRAELGDCLVRVGVQIETPAAALAASEFLDVTDYFEIGVNDLTQFTMAWDRSIPNAERLPMHRLVKPVAQLVEHVVSVARRNRAFVALAIDLPPSPELVSQLLTMAVPAITVSPRLLPAWKEMFRLAD